MYCTQLTDACGSLSHDHELSLWQDFRITPYINYACVHRLKKIKDRTILSSAFAARKTSVLLRVTRNKTEVLLGVELTFPSRHLYNLCG